MVVGAGADLLAPEIVKRAVDGPIRGGDRDGLWVHAALLLGALVLGAAVRAVRALLAARTGQAVALSLRRDVFAHVQRQSLRFFDRTPVGVLVTRLTSDVEAIEEFFGSGVAALFHDLLKLLLILGVMLAVNAKITLALLAVMPLLIIASAVFMRRSRNAFSRVRAEVAASNAVASEAISGMQVTRLFQREAHARATYGESTERLMGAHLATVRNFAFFFPTVTSLTALSIALVVHLSASGALSPGELLQFYLLIELFFEPVRNLAENLNVLLQATVSGERLFRLLDRVPEIRDEPDARPADDVRGGVSFEDVHFGYAEGDPVLRGVSFDVPAGTTTAIVGPTGAGKSSVLNLVSRFYDVHAGRVLVDGVDVRRYAQRSLRSRIAVVLQDVFLFRGSVLENIRLFDPTVARERVEEALRAVRAEGVVARLPGGLDAQVEERGQNLSVGERQLIAFARALVHDPAILVLDEATSSIDTATEVRIQEAIERLRRDRTTIVVAHRLSTIRNADQILVLRRGEVVERGDHAALLAAGGLYRRLYELQAQREDVAAAEQGSAPTA
jgi:ABC-type multidrug transport system fused ATPase/permease subunit